MLEHLVLGSEHEHSNFAEPKHVLEHCALGLNIKTFIYHTLKFSELKKFSKFLRYLNFWCPKNFIYEGGDIYIRNLLFMRNKNI